MNVEELEDFFLKDTVGTAQDKQGTHEQNITKQKAVKDHPSNDTE